MPTVSRRRRPGPPRSRGVGAFAAVPLSVLVVLAGCSSDTVEIEPPDLDGGEATACEALVAALPGTLSGRARRAVEPEGAPGAAWGDPAYVLTCGVPRPDDVPRTAQCNEVRGIGWFLPEEELADLGADVTTTALTHTPYVALEVPADYRTDGLDAALAELAPLLKDHLTEDQPCL